MIKDPKWVYFWWSASEVYRVRFVRWAVMRRHDGVEDGNKLGVGAVVESSWLFSRPLYKKIPYGCKRGQGTLRPYTDLYRTYRGARTRRGKIRRSSIEEVRNSK